jgi:hypothetical protein
MTNKEAEKWISSMKEEMNSMNQNNVFDFDTPCPTGVTPIDCK